MNNNEQLILKKIYEYIRKNGYMPSYRYLQQELGYKSHNSISQYIKSLERKGYFERNNIGKLVLNYCFLNKYFIVNIKIINTKHQYLPYIVNDNNQYIAYMIKKNCFYDDNIIKNDILIIKRTDKLNNNDYGLFIIDEKYRLMKYKYNNGFYILNDDEEIILNKVKTIGKVVAVERKK